MITKQERLEALERQRVRLRVRIERLDQLSNRYSWTRVAIFFSGMAVSAALLIGVNRWLALGMVFVTFLVFGIVAHYQGKVDRSGSRHRTWLHIKTMHIARMNLDWDAIPAVPPVGVLMDHPFETDLDITGPHSIHQLLNTAVSRESGLRLRAWLLNRVPDLPTILHRQQIVRELTAMTRFRDKLTMKGLLSSRAIAEQLDGDRLVRWVSQPNPPTSLLPLLWLSGILSALTIIFFVLAFFVVMPQLWVFTLLATLILFFTTAKQRGDLFEDATYLRYSFSTLATIFAYLETYPYGPHSHVKHICEPFFADSAHRPSLLFKRIARIAAATVLERNALLRLIVNILMPWEFYCAYRLRQYRTQAAALLPTWLDRWFELETLGSLATFAYLNPEYILPAVTGAEEQSALFRTEAIGHPLIPDEKKITNNFALQSVGEVVITTGSNMSGKSTFLRTLGVNLCLSYAGGPVNARLLQTQLFRLFTCIRVSDSVTDGYSYFYAEVRRLKALLTELEQTHPFPLFFLIDEIFRGTNNRERLIGSRAYVRALAGHHCVGIISTHDLELVKLADTLPDVINDHFREEVIDGRMVFDYTLRPGPSPTTNALKIMHMEGLPIGNGNESEELL